MWEQAAPYLAVRSNDHHSLHAFGLASALLQYYPDADPEVVLPAILLHDTGWSCVPSAEVLEAITPGGLDIIMDWFGLNRQEALRLTAARVHGHLFTDYGAAMAMALTSVESMSTTDEAKATLRC